MRRPLQILLLASILAALACGGPNVPLPSGLLPSQPVAADPEIARAIEFRRSMGLEDDEGWVRRVAADPTATLEFGVPLLPIEVDELMSRGAGAEAIAEVVNAYAAEHPEAVGGVYIDNAAGGGVVVQLVGDVATHEAAIRARLAPTAELSFVTVRWSEAQLVTLLERATADVAWFRSIGATFQAGGVDTMGNRVELNLSSDDPGVPGLVLARFGVPAEMLTVTIDGTGIANEQPGSIEGRAIDADGRPVAGLSVQYTPDIDIGGRDSIGIGTDADGRFVIEHLPPTGYTIELQRSDGDSWVTVGTERVTVRAGAVASVEIVVDLP